MEQDSRVEMTERIRGAWNFLELLTSSIENSTRYLDSSAVYGRNEIILTLSGLERVEHTGEMFWYLAKLTWIWCC